LRRIGFAYVDKKQLVSYAVVAFVIGSLLGGAMWDFGGVYTLEPTVPATVTFGSLNRFSSYEELKTFLKTRTVDSGLRLKGGGLPWGESISFLAEPLATVSDSAGSQEYSGTNIQVEGVDEADLVKTDGE